MLNFRAREQKSDLIAPRSSPSSLRAKLGRKLVELGPFNGRASSPVEFDKSHDRVAKKLVQLNGVTKTFVTSAGEFHALKNVNLSVQRGEFVSIIGKSGSGKSTLLNILTGIDRPTTGEVLVDGRAIHTLSEEEMALWRGQTVGVIFQFFQLLPTLTAVENILLPMDFECQIPPGERPERALHLLELVGLAGIAHKLPSSLSGGEQQRIAIARALANDPPLLTADEPTGNLDSKTTEDVLQLFEALVLQGKTILVVTHDSDLAKRTQRTIQLADGGLLMSITEALVPTAVSPALASPTPIIEVRQLVKAYTNQAKTVTALKGVDLQVYPGEFLVVTGKSGAGKTTLVNMLTGLDRCTSGEIWVADAPLHHFGPDKAARWRGGKCGCRLPNVRTPTQHHRLAKRNAANGLRPSRFNFTAPPSCAGSTGASRDCRTCAQATFCRFWGAATACRHCPCPGQ